MIDLKSLKPKKSPVNLSTLTPVKPKTYYGKAAVSEVEKNEGRALSLSERRVVEEEGYVSGYYKDDKGVETGGVGQTGKWKTKTFAETFQAHQEDAKRLVKDFDVMPEYLQAELVQVAYRGDLNQSPKAMGLINNGKYKEGAKELLNNKEYKDRKKKGDDGVTRRLESLYKALMKFSDNQPTP